MLARTAELVQANAELARSNTELEHFAYVASHDLREPLRKIKSYTELLAEDYQGQLDTKADKYMAYITDGASRMQALISDLLIYSQVGKGELTVEPTDLEVIVNRSLSDLNLAISENNAEITVKSLPTVTVNPQQMTQLFQNLIANALKFRNKTAASILIQADAIRPSLIVLDLNLPGLSGLEILTAIKSDQRLKTIPVVILTTSDANTDILKSYELGVNGYVTKPIGLKEFVKIVNSMLKSKRICLSPLAEPVMLARLVGLDWGYQLSRSA